jgi:hypothetical protein
MYQSSTLFGGWLVAQALVNLTNILSAVFLPFIFQQKNYKPKLCPHKSCAKQFGMKKLLLRYW